MRKNHISIEFKAEFGEVKYEYRHAVHEDGNYTPSMENTGGDIEALSEFYKLAKNEARSLTAKLQSAIESINADLGDVHIFVAGRGK